MTKKHLSSVTARRTFLKRVAMGGAFALSGHWGIDLAAEAAPTAIGPFASPSPGPYPKGRTPWAVILCRFNDLPALSTPISEFNDFIAGAGKGGVFDYWRDVSYGAIDLTGSRVFGWYTMKYSFFKEGAQARGAWIAEAIRLAKENGIDLSAYYGVIAVVNSNVDDSNQGRNLALGTRAEWGQSNWRWCKKCMALAYAGNPPAACPATGVHDLLSSWNYTMAMGMPSFPGQDNWRWCNKCQCMTYAGFGPGICSVGGGHDHTRSGDYKLALGKAGFPGQNNWRWCKRCQVLAYAGKAPGACPAGGKHDHSSSGDYTLVAPVYDYETHFDAAFAAHEMGHCYGLSHAHCAGKPDEYCDPWDIMGAGYSYKNKSVRYAPVGPGLDAPHLSILGWLPEDRVKTVIPGMPAMPGGTIHLAALNRPDVKGYLMAKIVGPGGVRTIEFRQRTRWDRGLPDDAVVIHELRTSAGVVQPFLLGDYRAGQRWVDFDKGNSVTIDAIDNASATATITI